MDRRGYTIVELIIVIAIMGILIVLAVVNLRGSQSNSRDAARTADVQTIMLNLEAYYHDGNFNTGATGGSYPSTATSSDTNANIQTALDDIDPKALVAPGISDMTYKSFVSATNTTQTAAGVTASGWPSVNLFVYQPLYLDATNTWQLCTSLAQGCRKYNIYYELENATTACPGPNNICMLTSKNQ